MALDPKKELLGSIDMFSHLMTMDLDAVPDEQATASNGGCSRSAVNVAAECAAFNEVCAGLITGQPGKYNSFDDVVAFAQQCPNKAEAKSALQQSVETLKAAVNSQETDQLADEIMAPWGQPLTKYSLGNIAAGHMWYHNGQIAYIQTLNNDGEMHWMP